MTMSIALEFPTNGTNWPARGCISPPESCLFKPHISAYNDAVRRKPGALVPLERAICETAAGLHRSGIQEFHGYELAKQLGDFADRRLLTAYGTLYRALGRLEQMGLLKSRWEDPEIPARENRPGRRLYRLTAAGEAAVREAALAARIAERRVRRRLASA